MRQREHKYSRVTAGRRFGRLVFLRHTGSRNCDCLCDCGRTINVKTYNVTGGNTKSCGCLRKETAADICRKRAFIHGGSCAPEYQIWRNMLRRCFDPRCDGYRHYGGRGIKVCGKWLDYNTFITDVGFRPSSKHSIDRIDVNGDYEPSNCRWATAKEQSLNRRKCSVSASELELLQEKADKLELYERMFGTITLEAEATYWESL